MSYGKRWAIPLGGLLPPFGGEGSSSLTPVAFRGGLLHRDRNSQELKKAMPIKMMDMASLQ